MRNVRDNSSKPIASRPVIPIVQLKEIGIDDEPQSVETANWFPKLARKDYQIGLNNTGSGVDDPDQQFFENSGCGSERNYIGYCNADFKSVAPPLLEAPPPGCCGFRLDKQTLSFAAASAPAEAHDNSGSRAARLGPARH